MITGLFSLFWSCLLFQGTFTNYNKNNSNNTWKTELFCFHSLVSPAVQCSGGQVYQECGRACGDSCLDGLNCDDAIDGTGLRTCVPGCQCPPGLMQDHRGQCVPISMCPCTQGGKTYQPGTVIQNNCNTWYVVSSSCINDSTVFKHINVLLLYPFSAVCFWKS